MRTLRRGLVALVASTIAVMLILAGILCGGVWLTLPARHLALTLPSLSAPVEITYDADWVPRIKAANELDAATALGFLHARDRMFQMDLMRRAASGRLSAIAGPATLPMDRLMRTLGLRRHAIADYAKLPQDTKSVLRAYARGVNAWIALKGRFAAPEFMLLGAPRRWRPYDSLLWAKMMGLWLSMNWRQELGRLALAGKMPAAQLRQLWPPRRDVTPADALNAPFLGYAAAARRLASVLPVFPGPFTQPQTASNEWAVDGRYSATGAPLLAGDPHLGFAFPSLWYLARIDLPHQVLAGATAPGVPFLVLGHNKRIAWTFTTNGADVQDIFIEKPVGANEYQTPDGPKPFIVRQERIKVRGHKDVLMTVRATRHGPVISDLYNPNGPILAVAMANLQPDDTAASGLLALNRARSVAEAGKAAAEITSPVQNLLVADRKTIALFVTGRVPIRKAGDGSMPEPGDGSHDWIGWASGNRLPHIVAPASGRIVNSNDPDWPPDFPVFMGRDTFGAWRADRIRAMLARTSHHTTRDFAAMQMDVVDGFARRILPTLLKTPDADQRAIAVLKTWDGRAVMNSPAPLIFNAWVRAFYQAILHRAGLHTGLGAPLSDFLNEVISRGQTQWCGGDCTPLLRQSLRTAMLGLSARFGDDPAMWRWGKAHRVVFAPPLLRFIPLLGSLTTIRVPVPGDSDTVNQGGVGHRFRSVHGTEFRGVYDLSDLDRSLFMMAPGQSGNPFSRHARDFIARWRDGATIMLGPNAVHITGTIRLTP